MLARLAVHHLSHTSSPFCSDYFGDGGVSLFAEARLDLHLPVLGFSHSWDDRLVSLCPAFCPFFGGSVF
jgi:hypothetical protein